MVKWDYKKKGVPHMLAPRDAVFIIQKFIAMLQKDFC